MKDIGMPAVDMTQNLSNALDNILRAEQSVIPTRLKLWPGAERLVMSEANGRIVDTRDRN